MEIKKWFLWEKSHARNVSIALSEENVLWMNEKQLWASIFPPITRRSFTVFAMHINVSCGTVVRLEYCADFLYIYMLRKEILADDILVASVKFYLGFENKVNS